jgi:anti-anti-sigma regulatory factor
MGVSRFKALARPQAGCRSGAPPAFPPSLSAAPEAAVVSPAPEAPAIQIRPAPPGTVAPGAAMPWPRRRRMVRFPRRTPLAANQPLGCGPVLALSVNVGQGDVGELAAAVARRVASGGQVGTVIVQLEAVEDLDGHVCSDLQALHTHLAALGVRLRLVVPSPVVLRRCGEAGLADDLGADAIHLSLRCARLAAHASQPGPGLITSPVRAALTCPAEPLPLM